MSCFAVSKLAGRLKNNKEGSPDAPSILNDFSGKNNGKVNKKGNHLPKVEILQEVTVLFSFCQFLFRLFKTDRSTLFENHPIKSHLNFFLSIFGLLKLTCLVALFDQ